MGPTSPFWRDLARFAGKALGFGIALGALFPLLFWDFANAWNYLLVSSLCSLVIGLGFHVLPDRFLDPAMDCSPRKAALLMQAKWMGICTVLLAVSILLLRLLIGPVVFHDPVSLIVISLLSLLITSLAVSQHTATSLVARTQSLQQAQARAGFLAIQAQLQPHTLFNALNTILALIRGNPGEAELATRHLAKLLRRTTAALDQELWPLKEEFDLLGALLELERMRFGERLEYQLVLAEGLRDTPVPPLLLVPLVENCLKHGFRTKVGSCHLSVKAQERCIRVEDDGVGCARPRIEGVGLRTVRERLEALGGRLSWPSVDTGCVVDLELP
jgi:sensor histidine kinase YesM